MPALDRLNQPWAADPTAEGGDDYRIFLADSKLKLRKAVRIIERAYEKWNGGEGPDVLVDDAEHEVRKVPDVVSIEHDWKHWQWENDVPILASLGIELQVSELPSAAFRVCMKRIASGSSARSARKPAS